MRSFSIARFSVLLTGYFLVLFIASCRQQPQIPSNIPIPDQEKENLITLNKAIISNENRQIEQYIAKKQLKLAKDSLGFWCSDFLKGRKTNAKSQPTVTYQYSIKLLDGKPCYSNLNTSRRTTIRLGKGESFSGLDMALCKMNVGEQADFIFPSILAYGVSGDGHRIPSYSPLVCTVKLLSCTDNR
jgi:FKBP-type peptidyl-prolyl cis-trans isomerase